MQSVFSNQYVWRTINWADVLIKDEVSRGSEVPNHQKRVCTKMRAEREPIFVEKDTLSAHTNVANETLARRETRYTTVLTICSLAWP